MGWGSWGGGGQRPVDAGLIHTDAPVSRPSWPPAVYAQHVHPVAAAVAVGRPAGQLRRRSATVGVAGGGRIRQQPPASVVGVFPRGAEWEPRRFRNRPVVGVVDAVGDAVAIVEPAADVVYAWRAHLYGHSPGGWNTGGYSP